MATSLAIQTQRLIQVDVVDKDNREEFFSDLETLQQEGGSYEEMLELHQRLRPRPPGNIYYRTFQTKDGNVTIGCLSEPPRQRMAELLSIYDPRFDEGYDPIEAANDPNAETEGEKLVKEAELKFREKTTEEWLRLLDEAGIPAGPLYFTEEMTKDEQAIANGYIVELDHSLVGKMKMYGPPLKMTETPLEVQGPAPALGEHTDEVLSSIGYTPEQIEVLRKSGVTR